jgi:hypothetical protein
MNELNVANYFQENSGEKKRSLIRFLPTLQTKWTGQNARFLR